MSSRSIPALGALTPSALALCALTSTHAACGLIGDDLEAPASIGRPCVADDESYTTFSGFTLGEISVAESAACGSGNVCLVHHFQGRVSCEEGQSEGEQGCLTPQGEAVEVPVAAQSSERPAAESVICSCRCDAPFAADFCACPSGMRCEELFVDQGSELSREFAGSYCVY